MSERREDVWELLLRANVVAMKFGEAVAKLAVAKAEASLAVYRFGKALRESEQRDVNSVLFEHPDVVELDMADAYWRPEERP